MSDSQNLSTNQPSLRSRLFTNLSLLIFPSIFSIQYLRLILNWPDAFRLFHLLPCQKSPSQKTATFDFEKTISGFPGSFEENSRYFKPRNDKTFRRANSGSVFLLRTADMILLLMGETRQAMETF